MTHAPDFTSVKAEEVVLAYSPDPVLKFTYEDERLKGIQAFMVEDSLVPRGKSTTDRLSTLIVRFPRPVLAEFNTHRVFSRNSASSRARSVKATIGEVMANPYVPVWTINKAGMSGEFASPSVAEEATRLHLLGRDKAVVTALSLLVGEEIFDGRSDSELARDYERILDHYYENVYDKTGGESESGLSIHKQAMNRGLEPYMFHEVVVTSSYWDNYLALRDHQDADPSILGISHLMGEVLKASAPVERWAHLPFISPADRPTKDLAWNELKAVFLRSAAEAAQVSYNDKSTAKKATASTALGDRLLKARHLSPFEHPALSADFVADELRGFDGSLAPSDLVSNFAHSWVQLRPLLAGVTK